jgi:NDP-4-keto-2,6-dideoxyhexose 3-C-methyltransferase
MVADSLFKEIHSCRICNSRELRLVFDLGSQALTGRFPAASEADPPSAPLALLRCAECGLVQLKHSVDTAEMFGENYGYRSGINATMRANLAGIAAGVTERAGLKPGDVALDIGCNDGTLLCAYDVNGLVRLGIDPIAEMFRDAYPAHLDVAARFFSEQAFREISPRAKANAITSISRAIRSIRSVMSIWNIMACARSSAWSMRMGCASSTWH